MKCIKIKKNQRGNFHKVAISWGSYIMWDEEDEGRARVSLTDHDMTIAGKCLPLHKDLLTFSNYLTENCPLSWDLTGSMKFRCITWLKMKESLSAQKSLQFCDCRENMYGHQHVTKKKLWNSNRLFELVCNWIWQILSKMLFVLTNKWIGGGIVIICVLWFAERLCMQCGNLWSSNMYMFLPHSMYLHWPYLQP